MKGKVVSYVCMSAKLPMIPSCYSYVEKGLAKLVEMQLKVRLNGLMELATWNCVVLT